MFYREVIKIVKWKILSFFVRKWVLKFIVWFLGYKVKYGCIYKEKLGIFWIKIFKVYKKMGWNWKIFLYIIFWKLVFFKIVICFFMKFYV